MIIQKMVIAGLVASASLAQAESGLSQPTDTPVEDVAKMVAPIGKEISKLTTLPDSTGNPEKVLLARQAGQLNQAAQYARTVQIAVDSPVTVASARPAPATPASKEQDLNVFLLGGLMVGAILLRRRAEQRE